MCRLLIDHGADVNSATRDYASTPLIAASQCGWRTCVRTLLAAGADAQHCDRAGRTALAYAEERGHVGVGADIQRHVQVRGCCFAESEKPSD
jgi:ankyrin repeat protein